MITCYNIDDDSVVGRIGNKLFVIATAIALAKRNKDIAKFPHWKYEKIFPMIPVSDYIRVDQIHKETTFHYREIQYMNNLGLCGYYQSYKYFEDCKEELVRNYLNMDVVGELDSLYDYDKCVSLHVRRGDYLNKQQYHPVLSSDYYREAISNFKGYIYLIFSDDMHWCKTAFAGAGAMFVEGRKDYEDMYIMSKCRHNIIANSSFSWWGAYLNRHEDKKVIAPKEWFGSAYAHYNTEDLCPKEWIKI